MTKTINPRLVSFVAPESLEAEQYRRLRLAVEQQHHGKQGIVIGVCSPLPAEGKTITALNLAGALAQNKSSRVLLVEVDLRRPGLTMIDHLALGDLTGNGLVQAVLNRKLTLAQVIRRVPALNLSLLAAGECPIAPYEILNSARMGELLAEARALFDYIIVDAPPVIPVPDCRLIAKWLDGFLMVVAAGSTPRSALEEALNLMSESSVLGIVFNQQERSQSRYSGYGYGYAYTRQTASRAAR